MSISRLMIMTGTLVSGESIVVLDVRSKFFSQTTVKVLRIALILDYWFTRPVINRMEGMRGHINAANTNVKVSDMNMNRLRRSTYTLNFGRGGVDIFQRTYAILNHRTSH